MSSEPLVLEHPAIVEATEGVEFSHLKVLNRTLYVKTRISVRPTDQAGRVEWEDLAKFLDEYQYRHGIDNVLIEQVL